MQLAKVLEVLALLVKYGYYDDADDVEQVLRPLVKVMNGKTDLLSPKTASSGGGEFAQRSEVAGFRWCVCRCGGKRLPQQRPLQRDTAEQSNLHSEGESRGSSGLGL